MKLEFHIRMFIGRVTKGCRYTVVNVNVLAFQTDRTGSILRPYSLSEDRGPIFIILLVARDDVNLLFPLLIKCLDNKCSDWSILYFIIKFYQKVWVYSFIPSAFSD